MLRLKVKLNNEITIARRNLVGLFVGQCRNGDQSKSLSDATACGQFIGPSEYSLRLSQRGIHGSAAALRVLAEQLSHDNGDEARDIVEGLVTYVSQHIKIETESASADEKASIGSKCEVDAKNVVKMSEVLYALSFVSPSIPGADELKRGIVEKLNHSIIDGKGWSYFFDPKAEHPELLPTAYAVYALSAVEENVSAPLKYLKGELNRSEGGEHEIEFGADITVRVACLYVLAFRKTRRRGLLEIRELRRLFAPMWRKLAPLLEEDIEQNVEYWHGDETYYVRVPWQLYLLAISAELNFWRFGSMVAQGRLNAIVDAITGPGFRYPHSGKMISSRTNAITYEILGWIQHALGTWRQYWPAYTVDSIRTALGSFIAKAIMWFILVAITTWSIYAWSRKGEIGDLAPGLICTALGALFAALISKRR